MKIDVKNLMLGFFMLMLLVFETYQAAITLQLKKANAGYSETYTGYFDYAIWISGLGANTTPLLGA